MHGSLFLYVFHLCGALAPVYGKMQLTMLPHAKLQHTIAFMCEATCYKRKLFIAIREYLYCHQNVCLNYNITTDDFALAVCFVF